MSSGVVVKGKENGINVEADFRTCIKVFFPRGKRVNVFLKELPGKKKGIQCRWCGKSESPANVVIEMMQDDNYYCIANSIIEEGVMNAIQDYHRRFSSKEFLCVKCREAEQTMWQI